MTVTFRGQGVHARPDGPFYEETDRALRQEAWSSSSARRLQDRATLDDLFDRMIALASRSPARRDSTSSPTTPIATASGSTTGSTRSRVSARRSSSGRPAGRRAPGAHGGRRSESSASGPGIFRSIRWACPRCGRSRPLEQLAEGTRRIFDAKSTPSSGRSSPSSDARACSTSPTARARRRAAIKPRSTTPACRSSS